MKVRIIVSYTPRYEHGHLLHFVPPLTGMYLAGLTSPEHTVDLVHEQVRTVPVDDWPDLVAITFFSGFAVNAYALADKYRALGILTVAGGPHVSYWTEEALEHFDAVVLGEAETVWADVLADASHGALKVVYRGQPAPLTGLPMPRYDLLEDKFVIPRVLQATRGCPYSCDFCTVPDLNPGFRVRPVEDVIHDIVTSKFAHPWQDKIVWFWDDNLLVKRKWAKDLLRELVGLRKWWLTQASIDIVKDRELLDLMERSGCIGVFLGIESLDEADLKNVGKRQNKVTEYREAISRLHDHGICVMAGFISGFDDQTPHSILATSERLNAIGIDVPFLSILTPFRGTALYERLLADGRILKDRNWTHYNGYNVAFQPAKMSPNELRGAHRSMWKHAFGVSAVSQRLANGARRLSTGGLMLSAAMNAFYGAKQLTGNLPVSYPVMGGPRINHPDLMKLKLT